jgi:hypothetical protein
MRNPLCVVGRHKWRTVQRFDQPAYVVCDRVRCGRYHNDGETVVFGSQGRGGPPVSEGPMGGGGGGDAGGGGGGDW